MIADAGGAPHDAASGGVVRRRRFPRPVPRQLRLLGLAPVLFLAGCGGAGEGGPGSDRGGDGDAGRAAATAPEFLLLGGMVLDGSGAAEERLDVGIAGTRIVFVGDAAARGVEAPDTVDVTGYLVTPGFIDMHSHAELDEPWGRDALPFIHQGITLAIMGVDGYGTNELTAQFRRWLSDGIGVNAMAYVGHNTARGEIMGDDDRAPTPEELDAMRAWVRQGMEEGALGLSSGLFYTPGFYAETEEVIELNRVAAEYGGIYDTHDRDLGAAYQGIGLLASIDEAIRIGEEAGTAVIFSHFNPQGAHNYGQAPEAARRVEDARARGVPVYAAQHVYTATQASLQAYAIPRWASAGGRADLLRRFEDPDTLRILDRQTMEMLEIRGGAEKIRIVAPTPELNGRSLAEVAEGWGLPVPETVRRILRDGNVPVMNMDLYDDWNTRYLAEMPWMMTCTDGRTPNPEQAIAHPRPYGAFTRKLRTFVLDEGLLTLPFAIRSMTGLAADFLGLPDRGYVREGMYADLVVLDLENLRDLATYEEPQQFSEGAVHVLVNGSFAIRSGEATGALAGQPLLRGGEVFGGGVQVARSPHGMVVSAKPLASRVGARVLEQGGNAVDAAVATALALTVVEPAMSSLGGRTQILVRAPGGEIVALDGGNEVVASFDPARMPESPDPTVGYGTVAIPGTVAALAEALERWGSWPLARVLEPAIALAEGGFLLTPGQGERWEEAAPLLALHEGSRRHFLRPDGSPYRGGDRFRQPALAETLRTLAREGPETFYRGAMAEAIHADVEGNAGFLTAGDLAGYHAREARVVEGRYRGHRIVGSDLPASGAWVVRILEILEDQGSLPEPGTPAWAGALADALVQGFEERDRAWAAAAGNQTAGAGGGHDHAGEPAHTTHLSVTDASGMLVALTQSIGPSFGSHVANPELGFLYASTQGYLATEPGSRPFSSMSPLLVFSDGEPSWVLGGAGARRIISAMVAVLSHGIDGGLPLGEAMAAPRFHATGPRELRLETRTGADWGGDAVEALTRLGYNVTTSDVPDYFARLHVIRRDPVSGVWMGAADPRRSGQAVGAGVGPRSSPAAGAGTPVATPEGAAAAR
ncbi:MAG: hypothetical protein EA350_04610 [Gemmatimonadales bacterium]|nr:MAG: hypothetical protein EA350_04610 [Gemmatimonadales bacterium]